MLEQDNASCMLVHAASCGPVMVQVLNLILVTGYREIVLVEFLDGL